MRARKVLGVGAARAARDVEPSPKSGRTGVCSSPFWLQNGFAGSGGA